MKPITEKTVSRICGLTLRALSRCDAESYASRMLRHALGNAMRARAAIRRGNEPEARRLLQWGLGSVRLAVAAGAVAVLAACSPVSAKTWSVKSATLEAFNRELIARGCSTDSDCEALARSHGLDPEMLDTIEACENGDRRACWRVEFDR